MKKWKIDEYYIHYLDFLKKKKIKSIKITEWNLEIYVVTDDELQKKLDEKLYWNFVNTPRIVCQSWYFIEDVARYLRNYWKPKEQIIEEVYEQEFRNRG